MCMRNYRGYDYNSGYPDVELNLEQFKHIFKPSFLQQLTGINYIDKEVGPGVNFSGNLGDFALAKDGLEIVKYIVSHDVNININTNGSLRNPSWWKGLALPGVQIGFALDGLADTHHLYRQDTNWHRIIENAKAFIDAGGKAVWRFVPFEHNKHQEEECRRLAKELGFARFENIYDGRDTGPVYTRSGEYSHYLGTKPKNIPPLKDMLESHIHWFESSKNNVPQDKPDIQYRCRHVLYGEIYLAADGSVYPCCFLGFYPDQMHHAGNSQIKEIAKENNALKYDLEHCLQWFAKVKESWDKPNINQGRLYTCVTTCGKCST